jgi:ubiquitin carboxyl-terminal hydrolase 4/11/15
LFCIKVFDNIISDGNNLYELYAICNHIGESGGGHYTAFCKNKDEWYKFDDALVTKETGNIVTSNAYVLFYRKVS